MEADAINAKDPLTCNSAAQCDRYWERLAVWVERNTAHKVKVKTDTVLEQWMPYESTHGFVMARREKAADSSGLITVQVGCMHILSCSPGAAEMLRSLSAYVRAAD